MGKLLRALCTKYMHVYYFKKLTYNNIYPIDNSHLNVHHSTSIMDDDAWLWKEHSIYMKVYKIFIGHNIFNLSYVSICSFPAEMQIFVFKNRKSSITYAKIIYLLSQIHVQRHILSATNVRKTFDTIAIYKWCRNKHIKGRIISYP